MHDTSYFTTDELKISLHIWSAVRGNLGLSKSAKANRKPQKEIDLKWPQPPAHVLGLVSLHVNKTLD